MFEKILILEPELTPNTGMTGCRYAVTWESANKTCLIRSQRGMFSSESDIQLQDTFGYQEGCFFHWDCEGFVTWFWVLSRKQSNPVETCPTNCRVFAKQLMMRVMFLSEKRNPGIQ